MWPFAVQIPDAYLVAALPVFLVSVIGLMAWIVREMGKIQIINAAQGERINSQQDALLAQMHLISDLEGRIRHLERVA